MAAPPDPRALADLKKVRLLVDEHDPRLAGWHHRRQAIRDLLARVEDALRTAAPAEPGPETREEVMQADRSTHQSISDPGPDRECEAVGAAELIAEYRRLNTTTSPDVLMSWMERAMLALRARTPEPGRWQDIASAPQDGTDVLLFWPNLPKGHPPIRIGWWHSSNGWTWQDRAVRSYSFEPTHWMSLPSPPEPST